MRRLPRGEYEEPHERRARLKPTGKQAQARMSDDGGSTTPETQQECFNIEQAYRRGFDQGLALCVQWFGVDDPVVVAALEKSSKMRSSPSDQLFYMHKVAQYVTQKTGRKQVPPGAR